MSHETTGTYHRSRSGIINSTAPRKNTNPGKSNFREAGYIELKMNAPIKLNKVSRDAMAENSAPEKNSTAIMHDASKKDKSTVKDLISINSLHSLANMYI